MHTNCAGPSSHPGAVHYYGDGSGRDSYVIDMKYGWERIPQQKRRSTAVGMHQEWAYRKDFTYHADQRPGKQHGFPAMFSGFREYAPAVLNKSASAPSVSKASMKAMSNSWGSEAGSIESAWPSARDPGYASRIVSSSGATRGAEAKHQASHLSFTQHAERMAHQLPLDPGEARRRLESCHSPETRPTRGIILRPSPTPQAGFFDRLSKPKHSPSEDGGSPVSTRVPSMASTANSELARSSSPKSPSRQRRKRLPCAGITLDDWARSTH